MQLTQLSEWKSDLYSFRDEVSERPLKSIKWGFAIALAVYNLYYVLVLPFSSFRYTLFHLGSMLGIYALMQIEESDSRLFQVHNLVLLVLLVIFTTYFWVEFVELRQNRAIFGYNQLDLIMAALVIIILGEYVRQAYGYILFGVYVGMIAYALFGQYFPGILNHNGFTVQRILVIDVIRFSGGAYGKLTRISALIIYIFMMWAGLIREFGGIQGFVDLAYIVGGRFKSGVYQIAIVSSMFIGMVTGAPAGNIVITGNITIPIMKDRGVLPERAAAIETVASLGGMVMPPVMGAGIFVMATLTGIPYGNLVVQAAVPAILLYLLLAVSVHMAILRDRRGRDGRETTEYEIDPTEDLDIDHDVSWTSILFSMAPVLISVIIMVYFLVIQQWGAGLAGLVAIITYLALMPVIQYLQGEFSPKAFLRTTLTGFGRGTIMLAPITIVLASMFVVVTTAAGTGLPTKIALGGLALVGGSIILGLLMVAVVAVIFGMSMSIAATYLLVVSLLGPMLLDFGVQTLNVHMFIFYWAMVSTMTPPVAMSAAIASNVAEASFLGTAKEAMIIGLPYYLIPFSFVFYPDILWPREGLSTLLSAVILLITLFLVSAGLQWPFRNKVVNFLSGAGGLGVFYFGTLLL